MNFREVELGRIFSEWLDRRSCPLDLRDKPEAARKESDALLRCLLKFAPQSDYQPFANRALDQLDYQMKTRVWPTVNEFAAACSNVRKDQRIENPSAGASGEIDMRPVAITSRAMAKGLPVGEGWLWGRNAVGMIAEGLIDRETMERYRSGAFLARKSVYGEPAALAWEAEAKQRHEDAKVIYRQSSAPGRDVRVPTNRALEGFAA